MNRTTGILMFSLCMLFPQGVFAQQTTASRDINQQLLEAAGKGDKAAVEGLLAQGADKNAKDKEGSSALRLAARGGHADLVDLLLAAKAPSAFALNNCNVPVDSIPDASQIVEIQ